ncbi:MAG: ZPR1 zinc finger domain-containing protein [Candidatus Lokiarchaeota archaeon]|nr:ZPR1 zinc finger domain-containing protein [Candidatus Lokiarchaeota archaeon]MBD3199348.1 ZPR1 zinc finger domain-containing protein [Candidatus Lokiarchaeota archaeon]
MSEKKSNEEDSTILRCPSCKQGILQISKVIYDTKDGDKLLIFKLECDKCNFINKDVIPYTTRNEQGISKLKVQNQEDLKSKIYRSPSGILEIPELELKVEPGPSAQFYFTNVEGVITRFQGAVNIYLKDIGEKDPEFDDIKEIADNLEKAINGEYSFTLIIRDQSGGSYIVPENEKNYSFEKIINKDD